MNRKSLVLVALAICLLPAIAEAGSRSYGHYGRRPSRGFDFSIGFGGHRDYGSFRYSNYHRPSVSFGYNYRYIGRPTYYRTRSYYRPVVTRYYDEPCYDYRPRVRYSRNYYYEVPSRPYYPRRHYRYCD